MMEEDIQATSHKGEKVRSYPLQFKLMEITLTKEISKLIEKEYVSGERRKKALKKQSRIRNRKVVNENAAKELEENHLAINWTSLFLNGSTKDVAKDFVCQEKS